MRVTIISSFLSAFVLFGSANAQSQSQYETDPLFVSAASSGDASQLLAAVSRLDELAMGLSILERADVSLQLSERLIDVGELFAAVELTRSVVSSLDTIDDEQQLSTVALLRQAVEVALAADRLDLAFLWQGKIVALERGQLGADNPVLIFALEDYAAIASSLQRTDVATQAVTEISRLRGLSSSWGLQTGTMGSEEADARAENFDLRTVYYATTRSAGDGRSPARFYANLGGTEIRYGRAVVSVPRAPALTGAPRPLLLRLELRRGKDSSPVLTNVTEVADRPGFRQGLQSELNGSARKEVLLVVHGFNQSFEDAAVLTGGLASDLEIDGAVVFFSWPSRNDILGYEIDQDEATNPRQVDALVSVIQDVADASGDGRVYLLAHSMGNRLLISALTKLAEQPAVSQPARFEDVVFASPDVFTPAFEYSVPRIRTLTERATLYASTRDRALRLSGWLRSQPRAGDARDMVSLPDIVDTINTSAVSSGGLGHDDFRFGARDDLRAVIWGSLPAGERCHLKPEELAGTWSIERSRCDELGFKLALFYSRRWPARADALQALAQAAEGTDVQAEGGSRLKAALESAHQILSTMPSQ